MNPIFDGSVPALELHQVWKRFQHKEVLRGVNLRIEAGQIVTILGGSGSGKSVCLKHMIGLLRPDAGEVRVGGVEISRLRERDLVGIRMGFGFLFQGAALFDSLTVFENVAFPLREHRTLSEEQIGDRVRACLDAVALAGTEALMPAELSGGMRKRIGLARAIVLEPRILLYDEPTTGLDPASGRRIGAVIRGLGTQPGVTSVVVTHDLDLCFSISDRVALLKGGCIVAEGPAHDLQRSTHPDVQAFLAGVQDLADEPAVRESDARRAYGA